MTEPQLSARGVTNVVLQGSGDPLDETVDSIIALQRKAAMDFVMQLGSLLRDRIFGGSFEAMRARRSRSTSLRKLAAHPRIPLSTAKLHQVIRIYTLCSAHPQLLALQGITPTHMRAVLSLDEERLRLDFLHQANAHGWTVARLEEEVRVQRQQCLDGRNVGGRPRKPRLLKYIDRLKPLADAEPEHWHDTTALDRMDQGEIAEAHERLVCVADRLQQLRTELESRLDGR